MLLVTTVTQFANTITKYKHGFPCAKLKKRNPIDDIELEAFVILLGTFSWLLMGCLFCCLNVLFDVLLCCVVCLPVCAEQR